MHYQGSWKNNLYEGKGPYTPVTKPSNTMEIGLLEKKREMEISTGHLAIRNTKVSGKTIKLRVKAPSIGKMRTKSTKENGLTVKETGKALLLH